MIILVLALAVGMFLLWQRVRRLEDTSRALVARMTQLSTRVASPATPAEVAPAPEVAQPPEVVPPSEFEPPLDAAPPTTTPVVPAAPTIPAPAVSLRKVTVAGLDEVVPDAQEVDVDRADDDVPVGPAPTSRLKRGGFEELFGSKLPIWAGGITLAVAGLFIVKYSIDTGLLSPTVRVVLALLFAGALIVGAEVSRRWRATAIDPRVAQALAGAGIAVAYAAVLLAADLYGLIGEGTAFVALAAITAGALGLALRFGAPCAVLGLVGGLAAPALAGGTGNAATLAIYLVLAVTGLTAVGRMQGWRWLSAAALVGGFGWGGIMLVTRAIDVAAALSIGGYLLLLALAVPFVAGPIADRRGIPVLMRLLPPAAAAVQLAILIGLGGYRPLVWGLYALLGLGVIVLARLDRRTRALPPLALAIGAIVVALWPLTATPPVALLLWVLTGGVVLFGGDAALRLMRGGTAVDALQLGGALTAAVALGQSQLPQLGDAHWGIAAALVAIVPLALLWQAWRRGAGARLVPAILAVSVAVLLDAAAVLLVPVAWLPAAMATIALATAWAAVRYRDEDLATVARVALVAAGLAIFAQPDWYLEFGRLIGETLLGTSLPAAARYLLPAVATAAFAALDRPARPPAQVFAALLVALAIAQVVPPLWIALSCAAVALAIVEAGRSRADVTVAAATLAAVALGWALAPFAQVFAGALLTLVGMPLLAGALPTPTDALLLLIAPPAVLGVTLWRSAGTWGRARQVVATALAILVGAGGLVLFKQVFALDAGPDFAARGMAERLVLTTILYLLGWLAWTAAARRETWRGWLKPLALALTLIALARTLGFDVLIYSPLLREQAVGALPVANLLAPAYLLPLAWLWQAKRHDPRFGTSRILPVDAIQIVLVLAYAAAAVRQIFHGSLIADVPLPQSESIAFSLVAIALAVGFLLWGIRVRSRTWRIASLVLMLGALGKVFLFDASGLEGLARIGSFVALGFSLIGIGWLYSRYLTLERPGEAVS